MKLNEFQEKILKWTAWGAGVDAKSLTKSEKRQCDQMVEAGLIVKSKNHSQDESGMYCKKITERDAARYKREYGVDVKVDP